MWCAVEDMVRLKGLGYLQGRLEECSAASVRGRWGWGWSFAARA